MYNKIKRELYATDCECFEIKFYTADRLLLNHLFGLPDRASSRHFQERSSAVTFILKFFPYRIVNLLNISFVVTEL